MPSSSAVFPFLGRNYVPSQLTKVPDEILAEFFLAYLPCEGEGWQTEAAGGHEGMWETVGQNRHPSVDLSHVCRRWRRVALGTPRLWVQAEIYVPSFPDSEGRISKLTDMVRALTHRSGTRTMSFTLRLMARDKGGLGTAPIGATVPFKESVQDFVDAVCVSSARWRRFSMSGDETYDIPILKFVDALAGSLPALNYIHLDTNFETQALPTGLICPLIDTPALKSVTILQPYGQLDNLPLAAWSSLKSLTLGSWKKAGFGVGMHSRTALHLLKSLSSLIHLDIHMDHIAPNQAEGYSPVSLPHLQSLSLKGAAVAPGFAMGLTLPLLESLSFTSLKIMHRERQEEGILESLSRFGCTITRFELDMADFSEAFVVTCAESLMHITTLNIGELPPRRRNMQHEAAIRNEDLRFRACLGLGVPTPRAPNRPTCLMATFLRHLTSPFDHEGANFNGRRYRAPNLEFVSLSWQTNLRGMEVGLVNFIRARSGHHVAHVNTARPLKKVSAHLYGMRDYNIDIQRELANCGVGLGILDLQFAYPVPSEHFY
ncbi:hypothetical protein DFP72DRAFT_1136175 [Ephemerocybe angulata]|uniref:F-box domain-containing protein n=1 Tax=Ephemerocybe angulata TaxID=980116 RepID=A0A8H6MGF1_9AGAR|nr:hypothetical protein DFP72DRAFT_1136175 [Tulosesus angulatus]